jgi:hypothetical protein
LLPYLSKRELDELELILRDDLLWKPFPGPQTEALFCEADELFYGGAAGGGKSDFLIALGLHWHRRTTIFRREFTQLDDLIERSKQIIGDGGVFNSTAHKWRLRDGRIIQFAAVQRKDDVRKHKGRPKDLLGFDEISEFLEYQYTTLGGWLRTAVPGQRTRIVATGNPPTHADGEWVIRRWGAWIDKQHPHPAQSGELRWYAQVDGKEVEREDGTPFMWKGEEIVPRSRCFIRSLVDNNPYYMATGYKTILMNLPEPLRSQLLRGDFTAGLGDDPWQVVPTDWYDAAVTRWLERDAEARAQGHDDGRPRDAEGKLTPLSAMGADVARGGDAQSVFQPRYDNWFGEPTCYPGVMTPTGAAYAGLLRQALEEAGAGEGTWTNIDVIGVGASAYDSAVEMDLRANPVNFSAATMMRDRSNQLRMANVRAWAFWSLREALDPEKGDGLGDDGWMPSTMMIPPDSEMRSDILAARYSVKQSGVLVEAKEEISERLGRSVDKGDALLLSALPNMAPRLS